MLKYMDEPYTTIEAQVEYGLDKIDEDRTVEVSLHDLLYVYKTVGEFVRFFHQPQHYPDLAAVQRFLGSSDAGALHLLWQCYYHKLYDAWPEDIREKMDEGDLNPPHYPYYYEPQT